MLTIQLVDCHQTTSMPSSWWRESIYGRSLPSVSQIAIFRPPLFCLHQPYFGPCSNDSADESSSKFCAILFLLSSHSSFEDQCIGEADRKIHKTVRQLQFLLLSLIHSASGLQNSYMDSHHRGQPTAISSWAEGSLVADGQFSPFGLVAHDGRQGIGRRMWR